MRINRLTVVLDAADLATESAFWAGLLGGTVDAADDWHAVVVDGQPRVAIQLAPGHVPPEWPDGSPQQVHLDLWVDDIDTAQAEVLALGARLLQGPQGGDDADDFCVYADPAGHPFCLCYLKPPRVDG